MLINKVTKSVQELAYSFEDEIKLSRDLIDSLQLFNRKSVLKPLEGIKKRGYSTKGLFWMLFLFPFLNVANIRNFFTAYISYISDAEKDAFYELKRNSWIPWRTLVFKFVFRFKYLVKRNNQSCEGEKADQCLIVDDTTLEKRGKLIEGVSQVHDHSDAGQQYKLGFKHLQLCYWDGKSLLPIDFSLHREAGKNKKRPFGLLPKIFSRQFQKFRDKLSPGYQRKNELDCDKLSMATKMVQRAVSKNIIPDYVLCDSWFTLYPFIKAVKKLKKGTIDILGMCKIDDRKFEIDGQSYKGKALLKRLSPSRRTNRKLKIQYITQKAYYKGIPVKLFFVKEGYSQKGTWKLILTTDQQIGIYKALKTYQIRWGIEVFFKEAKQYLGLGKAQANDFDAQIADISIIMVQYILLTFQKRFRNYESIGALFEENREGLLNHTLANRIWEVVLEVFEELVDLLNIDCQNLISKIVKDDRAHEKTLKILASLKSDKPPTSNSQAA